MTARAVDLTVPSATHGADAMQQARDLARRAHPNAARVEASSWRPLGGGAYLVRVAVTTNTVPGWTEPWTGDTHAYGRADSVMAALAGLRRKRTTQLFRLRASSADMAHPCAGCGAPVGGPVAPAALANVTGYEYQPGQDATGYYYPKTKTVRLAHYTCSWTMTMQAVYDWGERMGY